MTAARTASPLDRWMPGWRAFVLPLIVGIVLVAAARVARGSTGLLNATDRWLLPAGAVVLASGLVYAVSGGPGVLRIGNAMIRRTLLTFFSYRFQLVAVAAYIAVNVVLFWAVGGAYVAALFGPLAGVAADGLPPNLVLFLLVGFAAWPVFWKAWQVTAMGVREEQWSGTFESIVPMPHGVGALPFSYLWSRLGYTLFFQIAILIVLVKAVPGDAIRLDSPIAVLNFATVIFLTVLCMWGMGLLFGGLAILYKQVGPVDSIIRTLFLFMAGIFVPLGVLPGWMQTMATFLPLTHAAELLRIVAIEGRTIADAWQTLAVLATFTVVFVVAGNRLYRVYVDRARRDGAIQGY